MKQLVQGTDLKITEYELLGKLPDPFLKADGTRLTDPSQWKAHREELKKSAVELQYGIQPPAPEVLEIQRCYGFGGKKRPPVIFRITAGSKEKQVSFRVMVLLPQEGEGPFPVIVDGDGCFPYHLSEEYREAALSRGVAWAIFDRTELAPDIFAEGKTGPLYNVYPRPEYTFGAFGAWAWGYSRVVDALERLKEEIPLLDLEWILFCGHSRGAKTAMLAGVLDERARIVNPNSTCAGGCGCYRIHMKGEYLEEPEKPSETLERLYARFPFWMGDGMADYTEREEDLPFDSHFLKALVAPRVLLDSEAAGDLWANPVGSWQTTMAAKEVWKFLGAEENLYWSFRPGFHKHLPRDVSNLVDLLFHLKDGAPLTEDFFRLPFDPPALAFDWKAPEKKA